MEIFLHLVAITSLPIFIFPAYHAVSQSYGLDDQGSSGDDSDASDLEVMDVSEKSCVKMREQNWLQCRWYLPIKLTINTQFVVIYWLDA